MISRAAIDDALDRVVDPCSNAFGAPLGLREMGLAEIVIIDEAAGAVHVRMRLTSPCCAYGPSMAEAARCEIELVHGVRSASVDIDPTAVWSPVELTAGAASVLDERRRRTRELTAVRPFDWSSWKGRTA